jgi:hypothetical protein
MKAWKNTRGQKNMGYLKSSLDLLLCFFPSGGDGEEGGGEPRSLINRFGLSAADPKNRPKLCLTYCDSLELLFRPRSIL